MNVRVKVTARNILVCHTLGSLHSQTSLGIGGSNEIALKPIKNTDPGEQIHARKIYNGYLSWRYDVKDSKY